jgi:hypothetical protein
MSKVNNSKRRPVKQVCAIAQSIYPFSKWDAAIAANIVKAKFAKVLPMPLYFEQCGINDADILSKYFKNVPSLFSPNICPPDYNKIRYLIGMRYHSIVFATQCGIPFISLSYQPKNDSFCDDASLTDLSLSIFKLDELETKINYVKNHYEQIRARLIAYRKKAFDDINYIMPTIARLIG